MRLGLQCRHSSQPDQLQEEQERKVLRAGSGLWTYPLSAQPPFPQLGKWNHVTGCAPVHVLSQVCAQVLARAATPRLVGTPRASWYGPGAGRGLAPREDVCPPSRRSRGCAAKARTREGLLGTTCFSQPWAQGPEWGTHGMCVCSVLCLGSWGAGLWGPLPQPPVRFHLRLKFHF